MAGSHHHTPKWTMVYRSWWHVFIAVLIVTLPLIVLAIFAELTDLKFGTLIEDVVISCVRLFVAYFIAVALAWVCATLFYRGRRADIALPVFDVLQSFPTFAALPLATYFWGPSNFTVIFFLTITVIWPILFSVTSSLKLMKQDWFEVMQINHVRGWDYIRFFLWPVTVPGLITGSIIGLGEGWEALVATEIIVGSRSGLGPFFQRFSTDPLLTALGIFALLSIIFAFNKLLWLPLLAWSHSHME